MLQSLSPERVGKCLVILRDFFAFRDVTQRPLAIGIRRIAVVHKALEMCVEVWVGQKAEVLHEKPAVKNKCHNFWQDSIYVIFRVAAKSASKLSTFGNIANSEDAY